MKKDLLSGLVRSQYKTRTNSNLSEILFDSSNLSQVVDRIVATETIGKRAHTIIDELKSQQARLAIESSALEVKQVEAGRLQVALKQQREQVQALAADYQSQLSSLDASAHALLARIKQVDTAIAAASVQPGGGVRPQPPRLRPLLGRLRALPVHARHLLWARRARHLGPHGPVERGRPDVCPGPIQRLDLQVDTLRASRTPQALQGHH
jgi:hypothetical protein